MPFDVDVWGQPEPPDDDRFDRIMALAVVVAIVLGAGIFARAFL